MARLIPHAYVSLKVNSVLNSPQLHKEGRSSHLSQANGIHILVLAMKLHKLYNKVLTCTSILVPTFIFYIPYFIVKKIISKNVESEVHEEW